MKKLSNNRQIAKKQLTTAFKTLEKNFDALKNLYRLSNIPEEEYDEIFNLQLHQLKNIVINYTDDFYYKQRSNKNARRQANYLYERINEVFTTKQSLRKRPVKRIVDMRIGLVMAMLKPYNLPLPNIPMSVWDKFFKSPFFNVYPTIYYQSIADYIDRVGHHPLITDLKNFLVSEDRYDILATLDWNLKKEKTSRNVNLNNIYCADFETTAFEQYTKEGETRVYLWKISNVEKPEKGSLGIDINSFFDYVIKTKNCKIVYFHNLTFDGEFILYNLLKNGYVYTSNSDIEPKEITGIVTDNGLIYQLKVNFGKKIVEFRCSYRLIPFKISKIGENVGFPKLQENHNYDEFKNYNSIYELPEEEIEYITRDVFIMCLALKKFIRLGVKGITIAGCAYKYWLSTVKDKSLFDEISEEANEFARRSYKGGITQAFGDNVGCIIEGVSYDKNSLYPFVMMNDMPVGDPVIYEDYEEALKDIKHPLRLMCLLISEGKIKNGYVPMLGFRKKLNYEYLPKFEDKIVYIWENEFNLLKEIYDLDDILCLGIHAYKSEPNIFRDYINNWINVKIVSEKQGDNMQRTIAKLMLNSLYGKFGTNPNKYCRLPYFENGKLLYKVEKVEMNYYYTPIASYITSLARCELIKAVELNRDRFVYCDTDSIYLKGKEPCNNIEVDPFKLGAWKYEGYYPRFKCLKAKCYIKQLESGKLVTTIAGLPKDVNKDNENVTFENLEDGLLIENVKLSHKKVKGGIVLVKTPFQIKVN